VVAESNRVIKVSQWLVSGKGCEERRVEAAYDQECVVGYKKRRGYEGDTQTDYNLVDKNADPRTGEDLDVSRHALARILQDDLKADKGTCPERS
jgi:hypothetical protein